MQLVSLIIPCYNEEDSLALLFQRLQAESATLPDYHFEYIFVDDGSSDDTIGILKQLSTYDGVVYARLSRNFGKESAMYAGLEMARGDAAIIMDADLQHPPELIGDLLAKYEEGYDQVVAKRNRDGEGKRRRILSRTYYKLVNNFVDVDLEDGVGDFRLLSRKAVDSVLRLEETNRFSKGIFSWIGYSTAVIEFTNRTREAGESKFSFRRLFDYAIDGVISFNSKPLRLIVYASTVTLLLSLLYIIYVLVGVGIYGIDVPGYFTVISAVLLFGSIQLFSIGVLGEYLGRIYVEVKRRPNYLIDETNAARERSDGDPK